MMCHRSGRPPREAIGFGSRSAGFSVWNLMPWPPQKITTFTASESMEQVGYGASSSSSRSAYRAPLGSSSCLK